MMVHGVFITLICRGKLLVNPLLSNKILIHIRPKEEIIITSFSLRREISCLVIIFFASVIKPNNVECGETRPRFWTQRTGTDNSIDSILKCFFSAAYRILYYSNEIDTTQSTMCLFVPCHRPIQWYFIPYLCQRSVGPLMTMNRQELFTLWKLTLLEPASSLSMALPMVLDDNSLSIAQYSALILRQIIKAPSQNKPRWTSKCLISTLVFHWVRLQSVFYWKAHG